ncbi:hypothetical protein QBC37DRAFT_280465 [Rhypophila decipiens]|uniref:Cytoskeleton-associated protein n=1 Tax=Rhypophila decipiens TaxID=261697 RepID=A0AAN6YB10_9PEZI|nr:hypothetical protein QBC37DRAFT_280465 [Rhypophila decipiens]
MPIFGYSAVQASVFWGALGFGGLVAVGVGQFVVRRWRDEAELKPTLPKAQYITQDTEDSLQLNTLESLLGHYSFLIRDISAKIICDRAINDGSSLEILLWGITNPDYNERLKNLKALAITTCPESLKQLHCWKAYTALVRSLELSLDPEQPPLDDPDWDECQLRDITEKLCLMFISQLIGNYKPDLLIKAKFVEKWLAKQNWGPEEKRAENFIQYMRHKSNRITDIVHIVRETTLGQEALINAGLFHRDRDNELVDEGTMMGNASDRFAFILDLSVGRARSVEQSAEEQRLRHRHREAMVLNDGSRPFNSDDIFQREPELGSPS